MIEKLVGPYTGQRVVDGHLPGALPQLETQKAGAAGKIEQRWKRSAPKRAR